MSNQYRAVVIGVSAGGITTLSKIFSVLKSDFSAPIAVVQHLHPSQKDEHIEVLNLQSVLPVVEAKDKEALSEGRIYMAPPDYHLQIERGGTFSLSVDQKVNHCRPSVDILFETAAWVYGPSLIGIVLTGANADGALGLQEVAKRGGVTMVEQPSTAECDYMPKVALELITPTYVLNAQDIAMKLNYLC